MRALALLCAIGLGITLFAPEARAEGDDPAMLRRVQELLRAHQADIFGCVQKEPKPPTGELLVRVFVGAGGRAERPEVLKDQTSSKTLGRCLVGKIAGWNLTALLADTGDQVVFPLIFKPDASKDAK